MRIRRAVAAAVMTGFAALGTTGLAAQEGALDQLKPLPKAGGPISPMFDGWYENADGSYTLSFGYINLNVEESPNIPIGPNNYIEPAQYNGVQPTYLPSVQYAGFGGKHERGAFAVTIPAEMADDDVVWTVRHNGRVYSIPGRVGSVEYELSHSPATEGSLPPTLRFRENGEATQGRVGIYAEPVTARVGQPIGLTAFGQDEGERERVAINVTFITHQAPVGGMVEYEPSEFTFESGSGQANTSATFSAPGDYVVRVRVDNFGAGDSRFGNQCCWTNGYIPVTVSE